MIQVLAHDPRLLQFRLHLLPGHLQHPFDIPEGYRQLRYLQQVLGDNIFTSIALRLEFMQSLVNFPLLELSNDLHVFLADGAIFEVVEFCGVVAKVQQIDSSFVLLVELFYVILDIEIDSELNGNYRDYLTILSVSYFFDCQRAHLSISCCLISLVFSWSLNFFWCDLTRLKNSVFLAPRSEAKYRARLVNNLMMINYGMININ